MHENISTSERLDRIGELLAKGVYLYLKKEKPPEQDDPKEKKNQPDAQAKRSCGAKVMRSYILDVLIYFIKQRELTNFADIFEKLG